LNIEDDSIAPASAHPAQVVDYSSANTPYIHPEKVADYPEANTPYICVMTCRTWVEAEGSRLSRRKATGSIANS